MKSQWLKDLEKEVAAVKRSKRLLAREMGREDAVRRLTDKYAKELSDYHPSNIDAYKGRVMIDGLLD